MSKRSRAAPKTPNWQARQFRVSREGQSLRSMTVASLRKAILSLHLKPGEKLTERNYASSQGSADLLCARRCAILKLRD